MSVPSQALQALLQGSAPNTSQFAANSRYLNIPTAKVVLPDGRIVNYVQRRFVPPADQFVLLQTYTVVQGQRLDNIAALYLGDPEQYWRIADANGAMRPEELTDVVGAKLRITLPQGIGS
jgi:hypothetical protein